MKNVLSTKKLSRTDFYLTDESGKGNSKLFFTKVSSLKARVPSKRDSKLSSYNYRSLFNEKEFTVEAKNKVESTTTLFNLLKDSNLLPKFTGTIFEMF